jgi:lipid-binding SYLF domain-containing protein
MQRIGRFTAYAGILAVALLALASIPVGAATDQQESVDAAKKTFTSFVNDPTMGSFHDLLKDSQGILIFPRVYRGGFIFGVEGGSGVLVVRDPKKGWSDPAFYTIGAGSFGLQIGVDMAEVVLLVRTQTGVDKLLTSSFKLGVDVQVALGPVGKGGKVKTADILAYARAKGAYIGFTVDGAVLSTRDKWNSAYYGKPNITPVDILVKRDVRNKGADQLVNSVTKAAK